MNKMILWYVFLFLLLGVGYADTLTVPLIGQEQTNWCWNASCEMILEYYGNTVTQTDMAAWAVGGQNVGNHLSPTSVGPFAIAGTNPPQTYNRRGCGSVLKQFGPVNSTFLSSSLTLDAVKTEIDSERPMILAVRWLKKGTDVGGHAIVLAGYSEDKIRLNDPWPADGNHGAGNPGVAYVVDYNALFDDDNTYYGSATLGNRWTQTLKTGRALDLCFLIDSTGSMSDDIANVKAASLNLINDLESAYKDLRIAVVDYRDIPVTPHGDYGDWITKVRTPFTTNLTSARNAINAISSGGGADWPEAVFSAIRITMSGSETGDWRTNAERRIILMGDAPGHNPEPWAGGYSYSDVADFWQTLTNKISMHALYVGSDIDAEEQFRTLAADTGGSTRYAAAASGVVSAMADLIDEFTETPRFPRNDVKSIKPVFSFIPPTESMGPPVTSTLLEIQKMDPKKSVWKNYLKVKLPANATSWIPTKPLKQGEYHWRAGYVRKSGTFTLPSGKTEKLKGATLMEVDWTSFNRILVEPADPELLSPSSYFTAHEKDVTYQFSAAVNAESYAMEIYAQDSKGEWKRWKKLTVKPSKANPTATILEVTVKGHKIDTAYRWQIQSLNYDRPKPVEDAWVDY